MDRKPPWGMVFSVAAVIVACGVLAYGIQKAREGDEAREIARILEQHWPARPIPPTPPRYVVETRYGLLERKREEFEELEEARSRFRYYRACALTTMPQYRWIALLREAGRPNRPCWLDTDLLEVHAPGWTVEFGPCLGERGFGNAETLQHLDFGEDEKSAREEFGWQLHQIQPGLSPGTPGPLSLNREPHFVRLRLDGELLTLSQAGLFPVWRVESEWNGRRWFHPAVSEREALRLVQSLRGAIAAERAQVDVAFGLGEAWSKIG